MTDELRVGIIGFGIGGRRFHAPLVAATPGLHVAAIVTGNAERAREVRATYPDTDVLPDADALFARADELDLIVVTTPNSTHAPLARRSIEAGVAVVVDKPFAPTTVEGQALVAAARQRGVGLTVFQNRRWDSDFLTVRNVLASGRLGDVVRFESRYDRWRPEIAGGWRDLGDPGEAGGLLYDLGSHIIDQAVQLFGPVVEVYAELDRRRPGAVVDDDAFIALRHANGVRSHLWASVLAATLNPRFRVLGTAAAFTKYGLDVQEPQAVAGLRPNEPGWGVEPDADAGALGVGDQLERIPTEVGRYPEFYAAVRDAVRGVGPYPVDPQDAVDVLHIIEAAQNSAREQRVVSLR